MSNMLPTRDFLKANNINLRAFCRDHNLPYPATYAMLQKTNIYETRMQRHAIDIFKEKGLFVEETQP